MNEICIEENKLSNLIGLFKISSNNENLKIITHNYLIANSLSQCTVQKKDFFALPSLVFPCFFFHK